MTVLNRRLFIVSGLSFVAQAASRPKGEQIYRFATAECDIEMTVEFHDQHSSNGFWFSNRTAHRNFCLSAKGEEGRDCVAHFIGSLAIAKYKIRPRGNSQQISTLREYVRTIDQDTRLVQRPPFDRTMELQHGIASDIQAFGYEAASGEPVRIPDTASPWYYFRQDLYLEKHEHPFLILHWKHALGAIRMLDVIPGDGTWPIEKK